MSICKSNYKWSKAYFWDFDTSVIDLFIYIFVWLRGNPTHTINVDEKTVNRQKYVP